MLDFFRGIDQGIFQWMQDSLRGEWMDSISIYTSNVFFWTPFLVFAAFLLYMTHEKKGPGNLFFAVAAIIISYQASFLISYFIRLPAPYVVEHLAAGNRLPAFQDVYMLSLPDWSFAAFVGGVTYLVIRLPRHKTLIRSAGIFIGVLIAFSRMYAGYAYFFDEMGGLLTGMFFGWAFTRFARHLDYLASTREQE